MPVYLPEPPRGIAPQQEAEKQGSILSELEQPLINLPKQSPFHPFPGMLVHPHWPLDFSGMSSVSEAYSRALYHRIAANVWYSGQLGDPPAEDAPLEKAYRQIGWWKGSQSPRELRRESQRFWASTGERGIGWLVVRLRQERNIEVLHAAASLLASLGPAIVPPILDELDRTAAGDNGLALLGALGKLSPDVGRRHQPRLSDTLRRYLEDPLLELREAAAAATAILPAERAIHLLKDAVQAETNPVVRDTLKDAIADRQEQQD